VVAARKKRDAEAPRFAGDCSMSYEELFAAASSMYFWGLPMKRLRAPMS
jgi:hypothetical protein